MNTKTPEHVLRFRQKCAGFVWGVVLTISCAAAGWQTFVQDAIEVAVRDGDPAIVNDCLVLWFGMYDPARKPAGLDRCSRRLIPGVAR